MESSGACNLKEVCSEAAIAAPIIKPLWSPAREEHGWRRAGGVMSEGVDDQAASLVLKVAGARRALQTSPQISQSKNTDSTGKSSRDQTQRLPLHTHPDMVSKTVRVRVRPALALYSVRVNSVYQRP